MTWIVDKIAKERSPDLEAWEMALREAVLGAGARVLERLLDGIGSGPQPGGLLCACGHRMESRGRKEKRLLTIFGSVRFCRSRFVCPACGQVRYPGDEALDLSGTTRSPALRRMMSRAGSRSTFKEARTDLLLYAGVDVSAKDVERVAEQVGEAMDAWLRTQRAEPAQPLDTPPVMYVALDGTGVPMTRRELAGRKGKQPDGSARTREAKLGCVFTQTTVDDQGAPVRDPHSTTFVGAIETASEFGYRLYKEAARRGLTHAGRVVVLGDGAEWIRTIAEYHFPHATQIIDLYHAREHVANLCTILLPDDAKKKVQCRDRWWKHLDNGAIPKILREAEKKLPDPSTRRDQALLEMNYLRKNREKMQYDRFRQQGLFVGSGVVEAGCKTIIGQRLKQSGMEWSLRGANAIISLRCTILSNRADDYWESRTAA